MSQQFHETKLSDLISFVRFEADHCERKPFELWLNLPRGYQGFTTVKASPLLADSLCKSGKVTPSDMGATLYLEAIPLHPTRIRLYLKYQRLAGSSLLLECSLQDLDDFLSAKPVEPEVEPEPEQVEPEVEPEQIEAEVAEPTRRKRK